MKKAWFVFIEVGGVVLLIMSVGHAMIGVYDRAAFELLLSLYIHEANKP